MTSLFIFDPSYIRRASQKIDYWGIGLLAVGIATLQIVLDKGQEKDWFGTDWITVVAIVAVVSLIAFLIYELHIKASRRQSSRLQETAPIPLASF